MKQIVRWLLLCLYVGGGTRAISGYGIQNWQWYAFVMPVIFLAFWVWQKGIEEGVGRGRKVK